MDTKHLRSVLKVGEIKTWDDLPTEQSMYACMHVCGRVCVHVHMCMHVSMYMYKFCLNDLEWNGFKNSLNGNEMATHFLSPTQALFSLFIYKIFIKTSLFTKILYTCENNKKNNEKQNSEKSVPALKDALRIAMCVTYLLEWL